MIGFISLFSIVYLLIVSELVLFWGFQLLISASSRTKQIMQLQNNVVKTKIVLRWFTSPFKTQLLLFLLPFLVKQFIFYVKYTSEFKCFNKTQHSEELIYTCVPQLANVPKSGTGFAAAKHAVHRF